MATIQQYRAKDGTISYRVRVQRKGTPTQSATFPTRKECLRWATMVEGDIIAGRHFPDKKSPSTTLTELIQRYQQDVLPRKQPETQERERYYHRFWNKTLEQSALRADSENLSPVLRDRLVARLRRTCPV